MEGAFTTVIAPTRCRVALACGCVAGQWLGSRQRQAPHFTLFSRRIETGTCVEGAAVVPYDDVARGPRPGDCEIRRRHSRQQVSQSRDAFMFNALKVEHIHLFLSLVTLEDVCAKRLLGAGGTRIREVYEPVAKDS